MSPLMQAAPTSPTERWPHTLRCNQWWRRRVDGRVYRVHQLHRKDELAELRHCDGDRRFVAFKDLRAKWEQVA
jgi:hypothetical protein